MRFVILTLAALVLTSACSATKAKAMQADQNETAILKSFLTALNSKDKATIQAFVDANCTKQMAARVDRMVSVSNQGAPFTLVSVVRSEPTKISAQISNANGVPISLSLMFDLSGKISGVMLRVGGNAPSKDYSNWTDLGKLAEAIRADSSAPAMAISVLHDGKIETAASGIREVGNGDAVKPNDPFSIGSIGKPLCSTVIGKLIEMGKLRWDETLAEALPKTPMKDAYKAVTIEEILHHRGGIPEELNMRRPDVLRIVNGATDPIVIRENYARDILSKDPIGKPDEKFAYSNGGYALLGHIAERVTGKRYEQLVKEMIFEPLGMKNSYTNMDTLPEARPAGHVDANDQQGNGNGTPSGKWQPVHFSGPIEILFAPAGGGMFCSAEDLVKFGRMHMDGLNGKDGLLKASTVQRLHQGIPEDLVVDSPADIHEPYTATQDQRLYACGWGIEADPGVEIMHTHNGSNGTMRAQLSIFPKAGVVVAAFVNCGGESEPSPPLQAALAVAQRYAKG